MCYRGNSQQFVRQTDEFESLYFASNVVQPARTRHGKRTNYTARHIQTRGLPTRGLFPGKATAPPTLKALLNFSCCYIGQK